MCFTWKRSPLSMDSNRPHGRWTRRWLRVRSGSVSWTRATSFLRSCGLVRASHQHGVGGLDHHQVLAAEHRHQARIGVHQRVPGIFEDDVPTGDVAGLIFGRDRPEGLPAPDVGPAGVERHYHRLGLGGGSAELLHHRVVDGFGRAGGEGGLVQAHEGTVDLGADHGLPAGRADGRSVVAPGPPARPSASS